MGFNSAFEGLETLAVVVVCFRATNSSSEIYSMKLTFQTHFFFYTMVLSEGKTVQHIRTRTTDTVSYTEFVHVCMTWRSRDDTCSFDEPKCFTP